MVASKVKSAMGFQNSPQNPKSKPKSPISTKKGALLTRTFNSYFPRASAVVQPRQPEVTELLHQLEQLRESESLLKIQLLEYKLVMENVSVLPVLEQEISIKELKIAELEDQNQNLKNEIEGFRGKLSEIRVENEQRISAMEAEMNNLRKAFLDRQIGGFSSSKRFKKSLTVMNLIPNSEDSSISPKIEEEIKKEKVIEIKTEEEIEVKIKTPRVANPPPRPALSISPSCSSIQQSAVPPPPPPPPCKAGPPPPPPPPMLLGKKVGQEKVRRVPEVVELYHSLMRRDSRRDSGGGSSADSASNARDMIGEIENRSAHLLAIKADVETQGDFIRFLIKEVESAAFSDIKDVVPFVKWLDDELSFLVDERAVLKHYDWPEQKADTLREAAFGYCDLKKLESDASSFSDDPRQPCSSALKKMQALFEKLEHGVYNLSRLRESATNRYKLFQIPINWMLDTGFAQQIKLASVKLAMKYMKRISAELEIAESGQEEEELIVQGVKFAFRVHQFAGGFDAETMKAFQELRAKATSCHDVNAEKQ